jgi:hypothetical protein
MWDDLSFPFRTTSVHDAHGFDFLSQNIHIQHILDAHIGTQ